MRGAALTPAARRSRTATSQTIHVQGNVHMIVGAGANIAVQIGDEGVVVVDTGRGRDARQGARGDPEAFRQADPLDHQHESDRDHTGGNETVSQAGRP